MLTEHTIRVGQSQDGGRSSGCQQLVVVNLYCPMVDVDRGIDQDRLEFKLRFYSVLQERCTALERAGK